VRLSVQTTGFDPDDLFQITSDTVRLNAYPNGIAVMQFPTGERSFELKGVAENCIVDGSSTISVNVTQNDTVAVLFKVSCAATGITITTQTAGGGIPNFFQLFAPPLVPFPIVPNGQQTYTRIPAGRYQLRLSTGAPHCVVNGDSTVAVDVVNRQITTVQFNVNCILEPRAGSIVFVDYARNSELTVMNADGTGIGNLNHGYQPSWSRDGKKIIYSATECDYYSYFCSGSLALVDPITRQREILDRAPIGLYPAWSPTDDVIAYTNANTVRLVLYDVAAAVSTEVNLSPGLLVQHPSWSPDGKQLVAQCWDPSHRTQLCIFNRDGSGFRYLTNEPDSYYEGPAWSPDGSEIVFTKYNPTTLISIIKPDGSGFRQLVTGWNPAWSPDGKEIIFGTPSGLTIIRADGTNSRRITSGNHLWPAWRP
jgi:hypothetical protein